LPLRYVIQKYRFADSKSHLFVCASSSAVVKSFFV
jgi:hypothetical protein